MEDVIAHQADLRFLVMQGRKLTEAQQVRVAGVVDS